VGGNVAAHRDANLGELRAGRILEAQLALQRALDAKPDDPELLYLMALIYLARKPARSRSRSSLRRRKRRCCQRRSGAPYAWIDPTLTGADGSDPLGLCWRGKPVPIHRTGYAAPTRSQFNLRPALLPFLVTICGLCCRRPFGPPRTVRIAPGTRDRGCSIALPLIANAS